MKFRKVQMTDEQIKQMVDRFLTWRLPENFSPFAESLEPDCHHELRAKRLYGELFAISAVDDGISFKPLFNEHLPTPCRHQPTGTNLFDAEQAEAMIRYLVEGIDPSEPRVGPVVEWPKDGKCPVHVNAYLRITWPDLEFQPICKRAQDCCWVSGAKDRKCYQVLWSPDEKDYEMPEPEVVVRYQAISHGADCEFVMPHTSQGFNYFIREEFHNGQLIGKPVVLTREEALMECEGG